MKRGSTTDSNPTHWTMVRRLAEGGDAAAWEEFYATYGHRIRNLARRAGLQAEEAEDAVQETVVSVMKSLPNFKADPSAGSFKSWLFCLARWRIGNQFEKRSRFPPERGGAGGPVMESPTQTAAVEGVADPGQDALERIWEEEWREAILEQALERLKAQVKGRHFQVFYLHVVKQQSPRVVAAALGIGAAQVHLVKFRLLPRFRQFVREAEQACR